VSRDSTGFHCNGERRQRTSAVKMWARSAGCQPARTTERDKLSSSILYDDLDFLQAGSLYYVLRNE
jgi:hypothetical protein